MTSVLHLCLLLVLVNDDTVWCTVRRFPDNFLFGVATAAYQVEGGFYEDGKGLSIWDIATHTKPSPIKDGSTGDVAADSYHLFRRDVEMMKELGVDFYRFSISWPRILPTGFTDRINQLGLDYYDNLIDEMLKNGIEPFVTIYHWDLPEPIQALGGWANPYIVSYFKDYAAILFEKFGHKVKYWVTINEPKQICYEGYGSDAKAPMLNATGIAEYMCAKNVLLAHAEAYRLYDEKHRKIQRGQIGISISCTWFEPASESRDDHQAAQDARQFDWGLYAHPIYSKAGDYPNEVKHNVAFKSAEQGFSRSRLPELSAKEVARIRGSADFLGVNSYTTKMAYRDASLDDMYAIPSYMDDMGAVLVKNSNWPQAESSWLQSTYLRTPGPEKMSDRHTDESVPWGFNKLLKEIKTLYDNPPVIITENGWSTSEGLLDDGRVRYYRDYLNALLDALEEGCDIKAYTAWSLMDNFEWMQGYTERFGLYEVDYNSPSRTRTPRKSAFIYKEIIRTKTLDLNYEPETFVMEKTKKKERVNDLV